MEKIKALVVDDKRITGDMFGYILGRDLHDVWVVQSADEAVELAKNEDFDIAFLDIIMPQKDGVQALKELKQVSPDLPVIMMTGFSIEKKREQSRQLGALACLDKPVQIDTVRELVKKALGREI